jgi:hypothetical protein
MVGRSICPHVLDQLVGRYRTVGLNQQRYEHTQLPSVTNIHDMTVDAYLDVTK